MSYKNIGGKKRAFDIISKFIYDSSMDIEIKFKCQEAANYLYDNNQPKTSNQSSKTKRYGF